MIKFRVYKKKLQWKIIRENSNVKYLCTSTSHGISGIQNLKNDIRGIHNLFTREIQRALGLDDSNGNQNVITSVGSISKKNNIASAAHFFVHFFAITAQQRRENE